MNDVWRKEGEEGSVIIPNGIIICHLISRPNSLLITVLVHSSKLYSFEHHINPMPFWYNLIVTNFGIQNYRKRVKELQKKNIILENKIIVLEKCSRQVLLKA